MRKMSGLFGALALAVTAISCGGGGDAAGPGGGGGGGGGGGTCPANTFCMTGSTFTPTTLSVQKGTTVSWQNGSFQTHNVVFGSPDIADIPAHDSGTNSRVVNTAGTYPFHCDFHAPGMTGTLTVTP